jgi:nitrile hydratase
MVDTTREAPASAEKRAAALEIVLRRKVDMPGNLVAEFTEHADDAWITANGAQMVARAWTDPEYRARMLADGTAAARALGFDFPEHHRNLVVLENTPTVHNVIDCTLCSCTAYTNIGAPPDWYKDLDYRARVDRESRTVLRETGLDLPAITEIRVWDTTADTRYMVLPIQPPATIGWPVQHRGARPLVDLAHAAVD